MGKYDILPPEDDPDDPFRGVASVYWAREMQRLREIKPRPIAKFYGRQGPTPEQLDQWKQDMAAWNKSFRVASKNQKAAVSDQNKKLHGETRISNRLKQLAEGLSDLRKFLA